MTRGSGRQSGRRLWWSLPGIVIAGALGLLLVLLWVWSTLAVRDFDDGDLRGAEESWARQRTLSGLWPESWKAPYNQGTARLAQGEHVDALEPLRTALVRVPTAEPDDEGRLDPETPECWVRTNLALAYDGVAAEAQAAGDATAAETAAADAEATRAPCVPPGQPGEEPTGEPSPPPGEEPTEPPPSPSPSPTPSDPRLEELQERNDRAREEAEQELQGEGGGFGGGQNW